MLRLNELQLLWIITSRTFYHHRQACLPLNHLTEWRQAGSATLLCSSICSLSSATTYGATPDPKVDQSPIARKNEQEALMIIRAETSTREKLSRDRSSGWSSPRWTTAIEVAQRMWGTENQLIKKIKIRTKSVAATSTVDALRTWYFVVIAQSKFSSQRMTRIRVSTWRSSQLTHAPQLTKNHTKKSTFPKLPNTQGEKRIKKRPCSTHRSAKRGLRKVKTASTFHSSSPRWRLSSSRLLPLKKSH